VPKELACAAVFAEGRATRQCRVAAAVVAVGIGVVVGVVVVVVGLGLWLGLRLFSSSSSGPPTAVPFAGTLDLDAVFRNAHEVDDEAFAAKLDKLQKDLLEEQALGRSAESKSEDLKVQVHGCVCVEQR
jgi:hypothetical protein